MKRSGDFKTFISARRSIDESVFRLPDVPEECGLDFLERVDDETPIADDPYSKSEIRESGLKIWDSVYIPLPKSIPLETRDRKDIPTVRSTNEEWESTKESLGMVGRPDGVHFIRPKGKYIFDLMNDDIRLLKGAHILTHRESYAVKDDDYTFGQTSDLFMRNMIKLFLSRVYDLPINVHPETEADDSFSRYGIEVFGSTQLRSPTLLVASSGRNARLVQDRSVVTVLGSVGIEPPPKQAKDGTSWKEVNKWSCLPTLVSLAGWECVDFVTHSCMTEIGGDDYYAVACSDLQEMKEFDELISCAKKSRGASFDCRNVMTPDVWFSSDDFARGLAVTPQLPCPSCIRIAGTGEGVVQRPLCQRPRKTIKEIESSSVPEHVAWKDYVKFMNNCITIGRTATSYASGSPTGMKRRNVMARKRSDKLKRIASLETRAAKKLSNGFVSEAEYLQSEAEKLKKEIENEII